MQQLLMRFQCLLSHNAKSKQWFFIRGSTLWAALRVVGFAVYAVISKDQADKQLTTGGAATMILSSICRRRSFALG